MRLLADILLEIEEQTSLTIRKSVSNLPVPSRDTQDPQKGNPFFLQDSTDEVLRAQEVTTLLRTSLDTSVQ